MNRYKILFDEDVTGLEVEAKRLLDDGWLPLGGVSMSVDGAVVVFAQAFVSRDVVKSAVDKYQVVSQHE